MRFTTTPLLVGFVVVTSTRQPKDLDRAIAMADTTAARINGWFPCFRSKPSHEKKSVDGKGQYVPDFECAEVTAPLCHDGMCKSKPSTST